MAAPQKPWENRGNTGTEEGRNVLRSNGPQPSSQVPFTLTPTPAPPHRVSDLPPLPQRPAQLYQPVSAAGYQPVPMSGYGGYNAGLYGTGYGGYSPYRGLGMGYNHYGGYNYGHRGFNPAPPGFENRFLQAAQEGSRDAFQSIESIVNTVTSVSVMLESTYYAMLSSFHAVLGVVDNFSKLRHMLVQFLSTITVLKVIRDFYRRLMYWMGLMDRSPQVDRVWNSLGETSQGAVSPTAQHPKWPLFTFIALLFGYPYLIKKFMSSNPIETPKLAGTRVRAAYPHKAGTQSELSFDAGEEFVLLPKEQQPCKDSGWVLATNQRGKVGFVPVSRLVRRAQPMPPSEVKQATNATQSEGDKNASETSKSV